MLYCHGSLYFWTDVSLFISFFCCFFLFLYILIVYHREHVLIFSWRRKKRSIYSCWMFGRWLFKWIKTTLACHSPACAAANPLWSESSGRRMRGKNVEEEEKKGCCYILSSGQCPCREPSRKGMYSIDPWWDETVTRLEGKINSGYFCFQSFSFFSSFFFVSVISHKCHHVCLSVSVVMSWRFIFIFFGFECPKKLRWWRERERTEVILNPPKNR